VRCSMWSKRYWRFVGDAALSAVLSQIPDSLLTDVVDMLQSIPTLIDFTGFDLFEVPSLDLPSLRVPTWLVVLAVVVILLFLVVSVAAMFVWYGIEINDYLGSSVCGSHCFTSRFSIV
jgi:hypothetical protein